MTPKIPMDEVPNAPTSMVPEGEYRARIVDVKPTVSSKGNDMWDITFRIIGGEYDDSPIYDNLVDVQAVWWKWKRIYEAAGYRVDATIDCDPVRDLMNKSMILKVVTEKPPPGSPDNWTDKSKPTVYRRDTGVTPPTPGTSGMPAAASPQTAAAPVAEGPPAETPAAEPPPSGRPQDDNDDPGPPSDDLGETINLDEDTDFF